MFDFFSAESYVQVGVQVWEIPSLGDVIDVMVVFEIPFSHWMKVCYQTLLDDVRSNDANKMVVVYSLKLLSLDCGTIG